MQKPFHEGYPQVVINHLTADTITVARRLGIGTAWPQDECGGVKNGSFMIQTWDLAFDRLRIPLMLGDENDFLPDRHGQPFHQSIIDEIDSVNTEAEVRFMFAVVEKCDIPKDKTKVLEHWDAMLNRLSLPTTTDFDVTGYLGLARQEKAT